ncbi:MAG TPA: universal stress protein [Blastocatellia bacterium]|nr:universal stress protein [Blastocatellia bacterium]
MKILIAYDGSACADAALEELQRAGLPREAEVVIISVAEHWLLLPLLLSHEIFEPHFSYGLRSGEEAALLLSRRACACIRSAFPGWNVRAEAASGSPARKVIEKAEQWKPDLIIIGSHGRTAPGRLMPGSVSQKVVTEAYCSVRVARGRTNSGDRPVRIIIGVDGSPDAEAAVDAVAARKWLPGSEARVVMAGDPIRPTTIGHPELLARIEEANTAMLAREQSITAAAAAKLRAAGLAASIAVTVGDPRQVLPAEAEGWNADCIFIGARGLSRLERFWLGSVSTAVVARAHCSVEIVRTDEQKQHPDNYTRRER